MNKISNLNIFIILITAILIRVMSIYFFGDSKIDNEWGIMLNNLENYKILSIRSVEGVPVPNLFMPPLYPMFLYSIKLAIKNYDFFINTVLTIQLILSLVSIIFIFKILLQIFAKKLSLIKSGDYDAVLGSRFMKESKVFNYPIQKLILNRIFNYFVGLIFWNNYNDYTNAFKIYKKKALEDISPFISESFNIFLEIPLKIISRKYKYKIMPINWIGRTKGVSKFKIKELRSKYLFTLIYCFMEKNLLNIKK